MKHEKLTSIDSNSGYERLLKKILCKCLKNSLLVFELHSKIVLNNKRMIQWQRK